MVGKWVSITSCLALPALICAQATPIPDFDRVPFATGSRINEKVVRRTIHVNPRGQIRTLQEGFRLAYANLVKGIPTRILIEPGTYREAVLGLNWHAGRAANTPLIVEGRGQVIWSGADVFPLKDWRKNGNLLVHPWPFRWGNFAYSWSAKGVIGHRSEMAFVNGQPLMPRLLEMYEVAGIVQDPARPGQISYKYLACRKPATVLSPGEFGVTERLEDRPSIYFRPLKGTRLDSDSIEVSVRRNLLDARGKSQLVLRNITFAKVANDDEDQGASNAVRFSIAPDPSSQTASASTPPLSRDILIDHCKVLWSAMAGLHIDGDHWTIRDSEFCFCGGSGIACGKSSDVLWERNKTNFNVWRLWRAGERGYYTGGFKMQEMNLQTIRGHESIGNCTMGAWWDIHCHDIRVQDITAIDNSVNLQFELCEGPFVADRLLLAGGNADDGQLRMWEHGSTRVRNSILYSNHKGEGTTGLYNLRWFGREDRHAKMAKITAGVNLAEKDIFIAGPNVPNFGMIDDIRGPSWSTEEPMSYVGRNNVFWSSSVKSLQDRWIKDRDRTGDLAARAIPVQTWKRAPTYYEVKPRNIDPEFLNPDQRDFRFSRSSPLFKDRPAYPQFHFTKQLRDQWNWFIKWSGYQPDSRVQPPAE